MTDTAADDARADLENAARLVVENWEHGDLAAAVRELAAALAALDAAENNPVRKLALDYGWQPGDEDTAEEFAEMECPKEYRRDRTAADILTGDELDAFIRIYCREKGRAVDGDLFGQLFSGKTHWLRGEVTVAIDMHPEVKP